ncbi:MAG: putative ABC transporter permease subunit [Myxococcota bacterium]
MSALGTLLSPRITAVRNTLARSERRGLYAALAFVGLGFWLSLFGLMYFLVGQFWVVEGFGPFLARKLLEMLLASLFVMLAFSNVITALSTYFLADDLELVLGLPVSRTTFHYARFLDTLAQSSWMMALFGLPVFLAYGLRMDAGLAYFATLLLAVPALLVIATNFGVVIATVLVNVFPARKTRELMVLLGLVMVAALFIVARSLRPERLVNAQEFASLASYLSELQIPAPTLFPPRWASEVLAATLLYSPFPWVEAGLLLTGAVASAAVARWTVAWGFEGGWSRAQEARAARFYRSRSFDWLVRPLPPAWRAMAGKELRVFARDPSQWSQVFLLVGVCGIYLVSIQSLPMNAFQGQVLQAMKRAVAFLNLGMGGFVMAAIAARFQFTAVSREGRAWWVLRGAPVEPATMLRAKSVLGLAPMLVVGMVVVVGSGILLEAPVSLLVLEAITTLFLAYAISGLAIAMGALWPDFRADTAARAASSPAAVFFMVVALMLVFVVLSLEGVGVWLYFRSGGLAASVPVALAAALCVFAGRWPVTRAADVLWARGL